MTSMTPQRRNRILGAAAGAAATVGLVLAVTGDKEPTKPVELPSGRVTDLTSPIVAPGDKVTVGVTLPRGARVLGVLPGAPFVVLADGTKLVRDGVWYELAVRNDGQGPLRFTGFISYEVP